jgi:predicted ATPase
MSIASHRNFLVEIKLIRDSIPDTSVYPFSIPSIADMDTLRFDKPVTFLVGENGSGKSTLIEAIAILMRFNPEGGSRNLNFATAQAHANLHQFMRPTKSARRMSDGFFLRAESFFNVASEIDRLDEQPSFGPPIKNSYGGKSLHQQSHGESFFALLQHRMSGNGLYILDEPEAALSPTRQLAMLTRMHELVTAGAQFLIATHSPILMAYPNAEIIQMGDGPPYLIDYTETEHYRVTKQFLTRTESMLKVLLSDPDISVNENAKKS